MNNKEKLELFKQMGWKYEPYSGIIISHMGKCIKTTNPSGYLTCMIKHNGKFISTSGHRLAYYLMTNNVPNVIDHIDRNKSNNKWCNLRNVSQQENTFNKGSKGYDWYKPTSKWRARIMKDGKRNHLGFFNTEEEAKLAYNNAKLKLHKIK